MIKEYSEIDGLGPRSEFVRGSAKYNARLDPSSTLAVTVKMFMPEGNVELSLKDWETFKEEMDSLTLAAKRFQEVRHSELQEEDPDD